MVNFQLLPIIDLELQLTMLDCSIVDRSTICLLELFCNTNWKKQSTAKQSSVFWIVAMFQLLQCSIFQDRGWLGGNLCVPPMLKRGWDPLNLEGWRNRKKLHSMLVNSKIWLGLFLDSCITWGLVKDEGPGFPPGVVWGAMKDKYLPTYLSTTVADNNCQQLAWIWN